MSHYNFLATPHEQLQGADVSVKDYIGMTKESCVIIYRINRTRLKWVLFVLLSMNTSIDSS